jgi:HSP20 family protein
MSALTRRDHRSLLPELLDWLEPPYAVLRPLAGQTMRTEEGVENGRYVVRAEMPGIDPEKQAEVRVANGILTIHADRSEEMESPHRSEFRYGSFRRHVPLPANSDENDVEAAYDKGIIEVSIGLKEKEENGDAGRTIPVRLAQHIKAT